MTDQERKVVVLVEENPRYSTFYEVCSHLGVQGIDPLDFIDPESHALTVIYRDVFSDDTANELMGYLISKHDGPIVFDIAENIYASNERLVLVNSTLLKDEDVSFLSQTVPHLLTYTLEGTAMKSAQNIYNGSKKYRDEVGI